MPAHSDYIVQINQEDFVEINLDNIKRSLLAFFKGSTFGSTSQEEDIFAYVSRGYKVNISCSAHEGDSNRITRIGDIIEELSYHRNKSIILFKDACAINDKLEERLQDILPNLKYNKELL